MKYGWGAPQTVTKVTKPRLPGWMGAVPDTDKTDKTDKTGAAEWQQAFLPRHKDVVPRLKELFVLENAFLLA